MVSCICLLELLSVHALQSEIIGTVKDEQGRAIENAFVLVHVANDPPKTDRTDPQGRFSISLERPGPYSIFVEADGFAPGTKERVEASAPLAIVLLRGIVLEGVVRDGRTRQPVADALVRTLAATGLGPAVTDSGRGVVESRTDRQGGFRLKALARGQRTVWAAAPGYGRTEVRVSDGQGTVEVFLFPAEQRGAPSRRFVEHAMVRVGEEM